MSRTIPHIKAKGIAVIDLTERNWHLNAKSLASLVSKIQATSLNALSVLVLDLFGNTSMRFKQADDNLSLIINNNKNLYFPLPNVDKTRMDK